MKQNRTYPLRLPQSLKEAVERLSREERTSVNQFVGVAVAEKVSALRTARFFADRKARAEFAAFDKIMRRRGGSAPRPGDEMAAPAERAPAGRRSGRPAAHRRATL
jgi:hypothetical protein